MSLEQHDRARGHSLYVLAGPGIGLEIKSFFLKGEIVELQTLVEVKRAHGPYHLFVYTNISQLSTSSIERWNKFSDLPSLQKEEINSWKNFYSGMGDKFSDEHSLSHSEMK